MDDPFWLISFMVSAFVAFFTVALLVQTVIFLLRIKNPRIKAYLRILPLLHLSFDLFLTHFSSSLNIGKFLNPLNCASCLQKLFLSFAPELKSYLTEHQIALTKYWALQMPSFPFKALLILFTLITALILLRNIPLLLQFSHWLKSIIKNGEPYHKAVENSLLKRSLLEQKTQILLSDAIDTPMAAHNRVILIPRSLAQKLPQDQFEAVLAHELEHLRHKDPLVKFLSQIIATLFWWIPLRFWLERLDQDQELAADASIERYKLEKTSLAAALLTVIKKQPRFIQEKRALFSSFSGGRSATLLRLHMLLNPLQIPEQKLFWYGLAGTLAGSLIWMSCFM